MQTTLEFLMLLSAAASLGVFTIGVYSGLLNAQKPLYMKLLNQAGALNGTPNTVAYASGYDYGIYASIANISYVNRSNGLEVIFTSPSGSVASAVHVIGDANTVVMPGAYYNVSSDGLGALAFSVVPKAAGAIRLDVVADFRYASNSTTRSAHAETYALRQNTNGTAYPPLAFSATLERRNESILYNASGGTNIYTASIWGHCSWMDWWYNQESITAQCGDANWYFWEFDSDCYWNHGTYYKTYCVKLDATNTTLHRIQDQQTYGYNATLLLYNGTFKLVSDFSDAKGVSGLEGGDGGDYGNASISSVSGVGPQPYGAYIILNRSGQRRAVNMSYYGTYQQYLNSLQLLMNQFNNTGGDPGSATQQITYLDSEAADLIDAPAAYNQHCNVTTRDNSVYYSCKPLSGLYYVIDADIIPPSRIPNQSISVDGSTINVR